MTSRVLYLFGCAAPPVLDLAGAVQRARSDGWSVCVGLTPTAAGWLEDQLPTLEEQTGNPVRSAPRSPEDREVWPHADAAIVAPATLNTVNSSALGLTPNFVTGYVAEAIGMGWPLAMMPYVNSAYATHPQFGRSVETLRSAGVRVLYGEGGFRPSPPGEGDRTAYPWHLALDAARSLAG
ncbi:flavoprotein [Streptomyces albidus (ex Kaewkla and Franco 2022)]|uniref:flavoprotein n=1 Tax=Streptomyces albidus (ex Kaewkla and Franco 2022) TaxID=722709 RepID=UPI0015EF253F|nr:flavoprotein [Streptomyces albidus (ex Kaewkla and Franco 2022)]